MKYDDFTSKLHLGNIMRANDTHYRCSESKIDRQRKGRAAFDQSGLRAKNVVLTNSVTVMNAIENDPDQLRITSVEDVSLMSGFSEGPMLSMWPTLASKKEKKLTKIIVNMGHFNEQIICRIKIVDKRK